MSGGGGEAVRQGIIAQGAGGQFVGRNDALTVQQQSFVRSFLANGGNAEKAAEAAGYAVPDVEGHRLTANPVVWGAILSRRERASVRDALQVAPHVLRMAKGEEEATGAKVAAARLIYEAAGIIGRNARGPDIGGTGGKPLSEMSLAELGDAMKGQKEALATLKGLLAEGEAPDVAPRAGKRGPRTIDA